MLDKTDKKLLAALQQNAQATAQELSDKLYLSASQIGRRKQRLEAEGYIIGYTAEVSPKRLGLSVQAFVQVSMTGHSPTISRSFHRLVRDTPDVVSVWTLTGEADYLLRVFCTDLAALNTLVHETFLPHAAVARVQTKIVMDQIKEDTGLPVI